MGFLCALAASAAALSAAAAWTDANALSVDSADAPAAGRPNGVFAEGIPFSMRGSYFTVEPAGEDPARPERKAGVWIQTVSTAASERYVARLTLSAGGRELTDFTFERSPWAARVVTKEGALSVAFADTRTLLLRADAAALSVKIDFYLPAPYQPMYEVFAKSGKKVVLANAFKNDCKFLLDVRSGAGEVDCKWGGRHAATSALVVSPAGGRPLEVALRDVEPEWDSSLPAAGFDESVERRRGEFAAFLARVPSVPARYAAARERAAELLWGAEVEPRGHLRRRALLMSKNWMNNVWSWDHAFNAIALADVDFDLAWDQFMCVFDAQDPSGQIPDALSDGTKVFAFVKPPVHGWALRRMMKKHELSPAQLGEAYIHLASATSWWLNRRDRDGNGLAEYDHGNDSGWDNSTAFLMLPPVETPELQAYLAVQADVVADLAAKYGRPPAAAHWRRHAETLVERMVAELFDEKGRPLVRQATTGEKARPATLQTRLAMLLGEKLPAHVRAELVREVAEDGYRLGHALATQPKDEWYLRDGYWRGPVWAPAVLLAVDGLRACSAGALAKEVSEEFCDMVAKTRFAENFDPISGAPQKDPGYTWTASVFLTLAHELTDEEAWTR